MSIMTNVQIITNEIRIKNNELPRGEFTINPQFTRKTGFMQDGRHFTELSVALSNTEKNPFPFDLYISITGLFELKELDEDGINSFLKLNAVQILFPYLRAMVSSITTTAFMPPITLPVIDVRTLFPEDK